MGVKAKILWIVAGIAGAMLSVYPLMLSMGNIEAQHQEKSWLGKGALMFEGTFSSQESERYLTALVVMVGLLIAAFILRVAIGNKKLQAIVELQVVWQMTRLFRKGESQAIALLPRLLGTPGQLKFTSGPELAVASTMAGLMNTQGGVLFIGVDKDGSCTGLDEDYKALGKSGQDCFLQHLLQVVGIILDPSCCVLLKTSFHVVEGKNICRIHIKRASSPVYVHLGERSHFYIREGVCTRELEVTEALAYIEKMS
ncbi:ATP-binding protein [Pontibacter sp. E15-1]|uniref:AlbA family DNA-binding domain-containing protein n=1 Tax=Pontibacter sp. E15-1 TaxID=2919918 RepID=UPI001F5007E3|nr:ATP-binding protein [Pontibacter sp. E15-1]MCJ8167616.1 ATP-binding protein [Pontibacter sp. E15-1]